MLPRFSWQYSHQHAWIELTVVIKPPTKPNQLLNIFLWFVCLLLFVFFFLLFGIFCSSSHDACAHIFLRFFFSDSFSLFVCILLFHSIFLSTKMTFSTILNGMMMISSQTCCGILFWNSVEFGQYWFAFACVVWRKLWKTFHFYFLSLSKAYTVWFFFFFYMYTQNWTCFFLHFCVFLFRFNIHCYKLCLGGVLFYSTQLNWYYARKSLKHVRWID